MPNLPPWLFIFMLAPLPTSAATRTTHFPRKRSTGFVGCARLFPRPQSYAVLSSCASQLSLFPLLLFGQFKQPHLPILLVCRHPTCPRIASHSLQPLFLAALTSLCLSSLLFVPAISVPLFIFSVPFFSLSFLLLPLLFLLLSRLYQSPLSCIRSLIKKKSRW